MDPTKIADEIALLSPSQKLFLAQDIWDSIAKEGEQLAMPEWQQHELDKRYAGFRKGKSGMHDWQSVHDSLRSKYK